MYSTHTELVLQDTFDKLLNIIPLWLPNSPQAKV